MNQCDGCRRGLPINAEGIHYDPQQKGWNHLYMVCEKKRYEGQGQQHPTLPGTVQHVNEGWD